MSKDTSTEHSLMLARASLHSNQSALLKPQAHATLALLLLDRSGSMQDYGQTPRRAANECIQTVQGVLGAENTTFALFTFGSEVTLDVRPQPVKAVRQLETYVPNGATKLYEAVYAALFVALEFAAVAEGQGSHVNVAISVISDGDGDTASEPKYRSLTRELARQARERGFQLQVIGIGVDSKRLALDLGFQDDLARTVEPTEEGVRKAANETSVLFTLSTIMSSTGRP